jgi:mono/diheme cytochrome c family protein
MLTKRFTACIAFGILSSVALLAADKDPKELYLDKCSICHGEDGTAKTAKGKKLKVKDIHETLSKMSEAEMIKVATDGKGKDMDAFGKDYSPAQIKGLVLYYRSLGK